MNERRMYYRRSVKNIPMQIFCMNGIIMNISGMVCREVLAMMQNINIFAVYAAKNYVARKSLKSDKEECDYERF